MQTTNLFALQHNCRFSSSPSVPSNFYFYLSRVGKFSNQFLSFCQSLHRNLRLFLLFTIHMPFCHFHLFFPLFTNKDCKYTHLYIHPYWNEHKTMSVFYLFMMVLCVPFWLLFGLSNQLLNCVIWIIYDYSLENMELSYFPSFLTPMHAFFLTSHFFSLLLVVITYVHISLRTTDFFSSFVLVNECMHGVFHVGI